MNRAHRAERNIQIRGRRAKGEPLKSIALEFRLTTQAVSQICADLPKTRLEGKELAAIAAKHKTIPLDAQTLAVIEEAKRNPAPPYKGQGSWPA